MIRVKICANRRLEDALLAVQYGADAVGFLVGQRHNSPDFIDEHEAAEIIKRLPPFVSSVLVTHLNTPDEIVSLALKTGVTTIQLHGDTTPEQAKVIRSRLPSVKTYKAVHVTGEESITIAQSYLGTVDAILLDTVSVATDQVGGTGKVHDWGISKQIIDTVSLPVVLAGGLNPDNVAEAIRQLHPYGVDVNSGTKGSDGFKDPVKLKTFIEKAKGLA